MIDDKAYCLSVSARQIELSTALYTRLPHVAALMKENVTVIPFGNSPQGLQQEVKATVSSLQAHCLGSYSLTQKHLIAVAFSYQNIFYFEVQSLFLTLETAVDQNNLTLWSIQ